MNHMCSLIGNPINQMQTKKTFIITGAYGGIGQAICQSLAENLEHRVILTGRNEQTLDTTVKSLQTRTHNPHLQGYVVDFSSKKSIEEFVRQLNNEPIHVLINNHATGPARRELSIDGIELQWATNVLGYIWMIDALESNLKQTAPHARIVNVASYWAGGLDIDDLEFKRRRYTTDDAYRQAKQANRMLTAAYAEKFRSNGITVNVCHPGDSNTKLSNSMGFGGHETPEQSARTPVYLALSDDVTNITGKYFRNCRVEEDPFMKDKNLIEKLYQICQKY